MFALSCRWYSLLIRIDHKREQTTIPCPTDLILYAGSSFARPSCWFSDGGDNDDDDDDDDDAVDSEFRKDMANFAKRQWEKHGKTMPKNIDYLLDMDDFWNSCRCLTLQLFHSVLFLLFSNWIFEWESAMCRASRKKPVCGRMYRLLHRWSQMVLCEVKKRRGDRWWDMVDPRVQTGSLSHVLTWRNDKHTMQDWASDLETTLSLTHSLWRI